LPWGSALKALKSALRGRVLKYVFKPSGNYFYIVEGPTGKHLVMGDIYCSCMDFYLNVIVRGERKYCYHIAAANISEDLGTLRVKELKDPELIGFLRGVLEMEGIDLVYDR